MYYIAMIVALWASIVIFVATAVIALGLLLWRVLGSRKSDADADKTVDKWIGTLLVGVLAGNAGTIFFLLKVPPPTQIVPGPKLTQVDVRAPAASSLTDLPLVSALKPGDKGFFEIPAGSCARFVSARAVEWTNDPLASIQQFIRRVPFVWDLTIIVNKLNEAREMGISDEGFLRLFAEKQYGEMSHDNYAPADRGHGASIETTVTDYMRDQFIPILQQAAMGERSQVVDCRPESPNSDGCLRVWKRVIWWQFLFKKGPGGNPQDRLLLGRFTPVDGLNSVTPSGYGGLPYPCDTAVTGSLVIALFREVTIDSQATLQQYGDVREFSKPDHPRVCGDSERDTWARLIMNDNIPEDNGTGYAEVIVEIGPADGSPGD